LGLDTLRQGLQIIPQEPVLFTGTIRSNIDTESEFSDNQVWEALDLVGLKAFVSELSQKLDEKIEHGGNSLSVGQRQLLILARAICARPKILVLDEASSALDAGADKFIQDSIRTHFKDTTVISVAHRVQTILDFDRIMVLDDGAMVEFDSPTALMEIPGGIFQSLVEASEASREKN
jgi:ABC-type multidrug transport system fused ATPase/permease subunit